MVDRQAAHWNSTYLTKREDGVSWFEEAPVVSTELISRWSPTASSVIDIGGGASRLVDTLLKQGRTDVTVLDLSKTGLEEAKSRLGRAASMVHWITCDVTKWTPDRTYDTWHDRAAFHFLTDPADRAAYAERLRTALSPHGVAIVGTFAPDGPERCSGLDVMRYDAAGIEAAVGEPFHLRDERRYLHSTPWGSTQSFQFAVLQRNGDSPK